MFNTLQWEGLGQEKTKWAWDMPELESKEALKGYWGVLTGHGNHLEGVPMGQTWASKFDIEYFPPISKKLTL